MIQHTTSTSIIPASAGPLPLPTPSPTVIPSEARNLSYGLSGGFSTGGAGFAAGGAVFGAAAFPTVKYLRIFSSRFGPSPRIASRSSTLLNGPYVFRICKILPAVAGPIPGTCCNSSDVAVLRFTGRAGGFFFAGRTATEDTRQRKKKKSEIRIGSDRRIVAGP